MKRVKTVTADDKWGFEFGCNGVVDMREASRLLAEASRSTLTRYAEAGSIRRGRIGGRVVFCRRSIESFIQNAEK
jgi:hypothetical protein